MANGEKDFGSEIPKWDERPGSLDDFQDKLRFFVLGTKKEDRYLCASQVIREMDPESLQCKICRKIDEAELTAANGFDGMKAIVDELRKKEGSKSIDETGKPVDCLVGQWSEERVSRRDQVPGCSEAGFKRATALAIETAEWPDPAHPQWEPQPELEDRVKQVTELMAALTEEQVWEDPYEPQDPKTPSMGYDDTVTETPEQPATEVTTPTDDAQAFAVGLKGSGKQPPRTRTLAEAEHLRRQYHLSLGYHPTQGQQHPGAGKGKNWMPSVSGFRGISGHFGNKSYNRKGDIMSGKSTFAMAPVGQFQGYCILCRNWGHKAVDCPHWGPSESMGGEATALAAFLTNATLWGNMVAFNRADYSNLCILDGGASMSAGGYPLLQESVDRHVAEGRETSLEPAQVQFSFAGGADTRSVTKVGLPLPALNGERLEFHCLPTASTPLLIGVDMLDRFGLVLDYYHGTVFSFVLDRFLPCVRTPGRHLALLANPEE